MTHENYSYCPLKNGKICEGECYDVQMVRSRMIIENVLSFAINREEADIVCDKCSFNLLGSTASSPMQERELAHAVSYSPSAPSASISASKNTSFTW